jgi:hypothetical protein
MSTQRHIMKPAKCRRPHTVGACEDVGTLLERRPGAIIRGQVIDALFVLVGELAEEIDDPGDAFSDPCVIWLKQPFGGLQVSVDFPELVRRPHQFGHLLVVDNGSAPLSADRIGSMRPPPPQASPREGSRAPRGPGVASWPTQTSMYPLSAFRDACSMAGP